MRKTIDEVKYGNKESYYIITLTDDDGKVINKETIKYSVRQTQINDSEYLILYDEQMNVIEPTYKYINHKMKYKSLETKTKSMQALKDLYEFSRFIEKQINEFDINDFIKLQYFIQGNTNLTSIDFIHMYQSKEIYVVGRYMGIIRDYLKYCRYKNANCIESVVKTMFEKKNDKTKLLVS